jgi:hypothetical protein
MQLPKTSTQQILIQKHLPHNFLAEKMILNCLLISSELRTYITNSSN